MRFHVLILTLSALAISSCLPAHAASLPVFEAQFDIYRNGKLTGKQITTLRQLNQDTYELTDLTTATKGMASALGFKRQETSRLSFINNNLIVLSHNMNQKVAFKKKQFSFKKDDLGYAVTYKNKKHHIPVIETNPMAAHVLPYALGLTACKQLGTHYFSVLKSEKTKEYQFTSQSSTEGSIIINRIYPQHAKRKTTIWLNPTNLCMPLKTVHQEDDDSQIETRLVRFQSNST